jgi:hypothetical protein
MSPSRRPILTLLSLSLAACALAADPRERTDAAVHADRATADAPAQAPFDRDATPASHDATGPASDPVCLASDGDRDSFGSAPSCASRDCDDRNPAIHPGAPEACNGLDDDCDGMTDEDLGQASCGVGACRVDAPFCADGGLQLCVPRAPGVERCNGLDDDCDGMTDEEPSDAMPCGVGACRRPAACVGGRLEACVPGTPGAESCNGLDDDCDGEVDEGFRAAVVSSSYTELVGRHDGCTSATRIGGACNAAIHRACAARGCVQSGFGPLENNGDFAAIACVRSDGVRDVPYATLATHHPGCTASTRIGSDCNAAIHRYCASQGFVTGFGPDEQGPDSATITCLRAPVATVVNTTYTALAMAHPGCTQTSRIGSECNAAIHRACVGRGFVSGFGPLENNGDLAVIACVRP